MRKDNGLLKQINKLNRRARIKKELKECLRECKGRIAIIFVGLIFIAGYTVTKG